MVEGGDLAAGVAVPRDRAGFEELGDACPALVGPASDGHPPVVEKQFRHGGHAAKRLRVVGDIELAKTIEVELAHFATGVFLQPGADGVVGDWLKRVSGQCRPARDAYRLT